MTWIAQCKTCSEQNLRHHKPVVNVRVCCGVAHKWEESE